MQVVLLRVSLHSAQSLSVWYTTRVGKACLGNLQISTGFPFRYLPMRLHRKRDNFVGPFMSTNTHLTEYCISGLSVAR